MMREVNYETKSFLEMLRALRVVLHDINICDVYLTVSDKYTTKIMARRNLIMYEKGSRFYKFIYDSNTVILDSRTARKLLGDRDMDGFIQINKSYVINMAYFSNVGDRVVYLKGVTQPISLSRNGRLALVKYIK